MKFIISILFILIFLVFLAFVIGSPFVYLIRINMNLHFSREKIEKWLAKNKYEVLEIKIIYASLLFNNLGHFNKKIFRVKYKNSDDSVISSKIVCRFSTMDTDYEVITFQ